MADGGCLTEEQKKYIATTRAVLIQEMGDRTLKFCLIAKDNPGHMCVRLREWYAVSNIAKKVQMHSNLSLLSPTGEAMQYYIDAFEKIFNRFASMKREVAEDLQIAMILDSFGDKKIRPLVM